jgi:hypothetical protein
MNPDDPTVLISELNETNFETRKIEIYPDGRRSHACEDSASGDTQLSIEPLPAIEEIASDPQFEVREISKEEFEKAWSELIV